MRVLAAWLLVTMLVVSGPVGSAAALDHDPGVRITASSTTTADDRVTFEATVSNTTASQFRWDFDDGSTASGWLVANTFDDPGTYSVTVVATHDDIVRTASIRVTVYPTPWWLSNTRLRP